MLSECLIVIHLQNRTQCLDYLIIFSLLIMFQGFIHFYTWYRNLYLQTGKFEIDLSGRSRILLGGGGGVNRKRFVHTAAATATERTKKLNFSHCHRHCSVNTITQFHDTHFFHCHCHHEWVEPIHDSNASVIEPLRGGGCQLINQPNFPKTACK